jgi:alanine racemase
MIALTLERLAVIAGGRLRPAGAGVSGADESAGGLGVGGLVVEAIATDSRRLPRGALFVALRGRQVDGHDFLAQAAAGGAVAALVEAGAAEIAAGAAARPLPTIAVASPLAALQRLAAWYRRAHLERVVAITGSNGKTVVKDALYAQLLGTFSTAASPGSFNSQLGVPLSVLAAPPGTAVCVFEAGISTPGEMAALREILAPDCGILTNVGLAHIAAFAGRAELAREKLSLFTGVAAAASKAQAAQAPAAPVTAAQEQAARGQAKQGAAQEPSQPGSRGGLDGTGGLQTDSGLISDGGLKGDGASVRPGGWLLLPDADPLLAQEAARLPCRLVRYPGDPALPRLVERHAEGPSSGGGLHERLEILFPDGRRQSLRVRTRSAEIVEDVMLAVGAAFLLGVPAEVIGESLRDYTPPPTRLEVWRSPAGVTLVNDLVSADPISVRAALRTASELAPRGGRKVFVFAGMRDLGAAAAAEYAAVGDLAGEYRFDSLLLVDGAEQAATRDAYVAAFPAGRPEALADAEAVRHRLRELLAPGDTLLLKGPRHSGIDAAALDLMDAMAPNRLVVDLGAMAGNIASFRRACGPRTRIMAMVKALAYGSDLVRLGSWFSAAGIDHLGVSTADEGIALRRAGITLPILVTLPTPEESAKLARFGLLPAVHSFALLEPLAAAARALLPPGRTLPIHLKVDTGLHRVGVEPHEALRLAQEATATGALRVTGLMTHFASADDPAADADTRRQIHLFDQAKAALEEAGWSGLLCHAAATAAAARFAAARYDMVRLGLGLYGIYPSPAVESAITLQLAVTLLSRLAAVRSLSRGDRVGYGGTYTVAADRLRAGVLPIGYHDGLPWSLSNHGAVLVDGRPAPILGRISMDSTVIDLTAASAATPGTDALLFGLHHGHLLRPESVAAQAGTIAYELLARLGPRVQRVYVGL